GPWKLVLTVNEFVAGTPEAFRRLTRYLPGLRHQARGPVMAAPPHPPRGAGLPAAADLRGPGQPGVARRTGPHALGALAGGGDVRTALEGLPIAKAAHGEVVLDVRDDILTGNERAWRVTAADGRLSVRPETSAATRDPRPRLTIAAEPLAIVVSGALDPVRAAE